MAVNNNSSAILAQQRLQKAQELIVQATPRRGPRSRQTWLTLMPARDVRHRRARVSPTPPCPAAASIPTITDAGRRQPQHTGHGRRRRDNRQQWRVHHDRRHLHALSGYHKQHGRHRLRQHRVGKRDDVNRTGNTGTGTTGTGTTGTGGELRHDRSRHEQRRRRGGCTGRGAGRNSAHRPPVRGGYAVAGTGTRQVSAGAGGPHAGTGTDTGTTPTTGTTVPVGTNTGGRGQHNNYSARASVTQFIDLFGRGPAARDVENINRDFYAIDLVRVANEIALTAKDDFFNVLRDQAQVTVDQQQITAAMENLRITQARFTAGASPQYDVLTARSHCPMTSRPSARPATF